MNRLIGAFCGFCLAGAAAAGDLPASGNGAPVDAQALERFVLQDCGSCHGLTLKGGLGPDIRPDTLSHYDRDTLSGVIMDGIPGTAMPPWRPLLSADEAAWIATYLLTGETR